MLDQRHLLAQATPAPTTHTYTRIPPLRLLDQLDPRFMTPAAQNVIQRTKSAVANLITRPTRAGDVGLPTGLLLLGMLLLSHALSEIPHHAPQGQPLDSQPQHSPSVQIVTASSQTGADQGTGSQPANNGRGTQTPTPEIYTTGSSTPTTQASSQATPATVTSTLDIPVVGDGQRPRDYTRSSLSAQRLAIRPSGPTVTKHHGNRTARERTIPG